MAQVQKQLIASQKFLVGLQSLPQDAEVRGKQLVRLMDVLRKARLTLEQSGAVLAALDSDLWDFPRFSAAFQPGARFSAAM